MTYGDHLAVLRAADPELGDEIAGLKNLEAVLKWAPGRGVALVAADLVQ